jgi:hypothetical protein
MSDQLDPETRQNILRATFDYQFNEEVHENDLKDLKEFKKEQEIDKSYRELKKVKDRLLGAVALQVLTKQQLGFFNGKSTFRVQLTPYLTVNDSMKFFTWVTTDELACQLLGMSGVVKINLKGLPADGFIRALLDKKKINSLRDIGVFEDFDYELAVLDGDKTTSRELPTAEKRGDKI